MPVTPTYPGVYIEEIPSGVRTITGVATSIVAFVGYFTRGFMDKATRVLSMADFERKFGGLCAKSEASYAIGQFFLNGGSEAWIVRTAKAGTAKAAAVKLKDKADAGGTALLLATAASEGAWGNGVRIDVDYGTTDPSKTFNLVVTECAVVGGKLQTVTTETFRNLIIDKTKPNHVVDVVKEASKLINLELLSDPNSNRPAQTGTISKAITGVDIAGLLAAETMGVSLNGTALGTFSIGVPLPSTHVQLASTLQAKIRAVDSKVARASVKVAGSMATQIFFQIKAGTDEASDVLSFTGDLATKLGLDDAGRTNVQQYALGGEAKAAQALPNGSAQKGDDGTQPDAAALLGNPSKKTGLYALEDVDLFNILCIPGTMNLSDAQAAQVAAGAEAYCESRRAFYILDIPHKDKVRDEVDEVKTWLDDYATLRHKNAALYYPRPLIADPLNDYRLRLVAPSGTIAGLYARIDGQRGVWKAPAGTEATLRGVQKLEYLLTDQENGTLNPLGVNCLRKFDVYGNVCWGGRTMDGADQTASEWKYLPVRRIALFLEESLYRGTKWVVFEPNDEPLWAQIRLNAGAFMHDLFRKGAFAGKTPREAYFVKCDKETTTQNDINLGVVNILVGFAPLKPAEFVIIKIQQMAGEIQG
jgi:uncharacterized protein